MNKFTETYVSMMKKSNNVITEESLSNYGKLIIEIDINNASFADVDDDHTKIQLCREAIDEAFGNMIKYIGRTQTIRDSNGNTIGEISFGE